MVHQGLPVHPALPAHLAPGALPDEEGKDVKEVTVHQAPRESEAETIPNDIILVRVPI